MVLFTVAPVHDHSSAQFGREYASSGAAMAYRLIFYAYLVVALAVIARTCLRTAFASGDRARSLSLMSIGIGAVTATAAAAAGAAQMLTTYAAGNAPWVLGELNRAFTVIAAATAAFGVVSPLTMDSYPALASSSFKLREASSRCGAQ